MRRALAFGLVSAQLVLLAALVFVPHGSLWPINGATVATSIALDAAGAILVTLGVLGLGPVLTPSPIPRAQAGLVTNRVYGLVRNPIYTGLMVGGLGLALFGRSVWHVAAWGALVVVLSVKTRWEERMLAREHPEYGEYAARVGRFLPGIGRLRPPT
ncbi:methyltransferase family protein [Homoserinimonas sp. A447]